MPKTLNHEKDSHNKLHILLHYLFSLHAFLHIFISKNANGINNSWLFYYQYMGITQDNFMV